MGKYFKCVKIFFFHDIRKSIVKFTCIRAYLFYFLRQVPIMLDNPGTESSCSTTVPPSLPVGPYSFMYNCTTMLQYVYMNVYVVGTQYYIYLLTGTAFIKNIFLRNRSQRFVPFTDPTCHVLALASSCSTPSDPFRFVATLVKTKKG